MPRQHRSQFSGIAGERPDSIWWTDGKIGGARLSDAYVVATLAPGCPVAPAGPRTRGSTPHSRCVWSSLGQTGGGLNVLAPRTAILGITLIGSVGDQETGQEKRSSCSSYL